MKVEELQTPCLIVEGGILDANLTRMARFFDGRPARLRPHFKSHKCTAIAKRQLAAGNCAGITCATLGEAEVLAAAGVEDILLANQLPADKLPRLLELLGRADVRVCVDCPAQVAALAEAVSGLRGEIGILVELDVGMGRCGLNSPGAVLELARRVERAPGLKFSGIQAYEGHAVLLEDASERECRARAALELSAATRALLERSGLAVEVLSSAGTGTYDITGAAAHVDEVQAGSYALMDAKYRAVRPEFGNALFVLTSCLFSRGGRAVFDVGLKGCGAEFGPPELVDVREQPAFRKLSEEHFIVGETDREFDVGGKYRLMPGHGCTTCNLHERLYVVEDGRVVADWAIDAAGLRT